MNDTNFEEDGILIFFRSVLFSFCFPYLISENNLKVAYKYINKTR